MPRVTQVSNANRSLSLSWLPHAVGVAKSLVAQRFWPAGHCWLSSDACRVRLLAQRLNVLVFSFYNIGVLLTTVKCIESSCSYLFSFVYEIQVDMHSTSLRFMCSRSFVCIYGKFMITIVHYKCFDLCSQCIQAGPFFSASTCVTDSSIG